MQKDNDIKELRKAFNEAVGNLQYQAVRSGIKSTSGTIQNNIEQSAKNLGEDDYKLNKQAKQQADNLIFQQKYNSLMNRSNYKLNRFSNYLNFGLGTAGNIADIM